MTHELSSRVLVEIEVPRWSFVKRQAGKGIEYVSPIPCPYNYGFLPGTTSEDGEPQDALVLGKRLRRGARVEVTVLGRVLFLDAGLRDDKLICGVSPLRPAERRCLHLFFKFYALARTALNSIQGERAHTRYLGLQLLPTRV